jgi:hypothetical protein
MNSSSHHAAGSNSNSDVAPQLGSGSAEATLRLIAQLPAPVGLEDRVLAGLSSAPRSGRLLHWPGILKPTASWMRTAAAAAIVFVVAGGGWGIYSRVQPSAPAKATAMPPHVGAAPGFSSAGAMRTPQTLNGPVVAQSADAQPAAAKPEKKAPMQAASTATHHTKAVAAKKSADKPAVTVAK